jgi:hypothetical protein
MVLGRGWRGMSARRLGIAPAICAVSVIGSVLPMIAMLLRLSDGDTGGWANAGVLGAVVPANFVLASLAWLLADQCDGHDSNSSGCFGQVAVGARHRVSGPGRRACTRGLPEAACGRGRQPVVRGFVQTAGCDLRTGRLHGWAGPSWSSASGAAARRVASQGGGRVRFAEGRRLPPLMRT